MRGCLQGLQSGLLSWTECCTYRSSYSKGPGIADVCDLADATGYDAAIPQATKETKTVDQTIKRHPEVHSRSKSKFERYSLGSAGNAALCVAVAAIAGVRLLHVTPASIGVGAIIGVLIILSATPKKAWMSSDPTQDKPAIIKFDREPLIVSRGDLVDASAERLFVAEERWHAEREVLPPECQQLTDVQHQLRMDALSLLQETEQINNIRAFISEANGVSCVAAHVRAFVREPDFPNPYKIAKLLKEFCEVRENDSRLPQMSLHYMKACREVWPRCVHGLTKQGHPVIWDGAPGISKAHLEKKFGSIAEGLDKLAWYDRWFCKELSEFKGRLSEQKGVLLYRNILIMDVSSAHYDSILNPAFGKGVPGPRRQIVS